MLPWKKPDHSRNYSTACQSHNDKVRTCKWPHLIDTRGFVNKSQLGLQLRVLLWLQFSAMCNCRLACLRLWSTTCSNLTVYRNSWQTFFKKKHFQIACLCGDQFHMWLFFLPQDRPTEEEVDLSSGHHVWSQNLPAFCGLSNWFVFETTVAIVDCIKIRAQADLIIQS